MKRPKSKDPKAPYVAVKTPFTKVEYLLKKTQTDLKKLQDAAESVKMDTAALERISEELTTFATILAEQES